MCHPYIPFQCPEDGKCISIQYLCDGAPDCTDGYDEDPRLCTAGYIYSKSDHFLQTFKKKGLQFCLMYFFNS